MSNSVKFDFIGKSTYPLENIQYDGSRTVNLYPLPNEYSEGKDDFVSQLVRTPGLTIAVDPATVNTSTAVRGSYTTTTGLVFRVVGNKLQQLGGNINSLPLTITEIGTLSTSSGFVNFADCGTIMCIVDGINGYNVSLSPSGPTSFSLIVDVNWQGASFVIQYDGYFIFNKPNTNIFYWSGLYALTFNGLDTAAKSGSSDPIVGMILADRQLWLFGSETTEVWYDIGQGNTVFQRIDGAYIEAGCAAPQSICKDDTGVFLIAKSVRGGTQIVKTNGYAFQRMSNFSLDQVFSRITDINNSTAFIYEDQGRRFYQVNPTNGNSSWVLDLIGSNFFQKPIWHERTHFDPVTGIESRHIADNACSINGKTFVGSYKSNETFLYDVNNYTNNGDQIICRRKATNISSNANFVQYSMFQVNCQTGIGLDGEVTPNITPNTDPMLILRYSDDGGNTWSYDLEQPLGQIGEYFQQVRYWQLGMGRNRVFEVTYTSATKFAIMGSFLQAVACST